MSDAARLAAVLLRVVAVALILWGVLGFAGQLLVVFGGLGDMRQLRQFWFVLVAPLLYLLPGCLLFRYSRPVGIRLGRGLD